MHLCILERKLYDVCPSTSVEIWKLELKSNFKVEISIISSDILSRRTSVLKGRDAWYRLEKLASKQRREKYAPTRTMDQLMEIQRQRLLLSKSVSRNNIS